MINCVSENNLFVDKLNC